MEIARGSEINNLALYRLPTKARSATELRIKFIYSAVDWLQKPLTKPSLWPAKDFISLEVCFLSASEGHICWYLFTSYEKCCPAKLDSAMASAAITGICIGLPSSPVPGLRFVPLRSASYQHVCILNCDPVP